MGRTTQLEWMKKWEQLKLTSELENRLKELEQEEKRTYVNVKLRVWEVRQIFAHLRALAYMTQDPKIARLAEKFHKVLRRAWKDMESWKKVQKTYRKLKVLVG